jgi:hypothetical protein
MARLWHLTLVVGVAACARLQAAESDSCLFGRDRLQFPAEYAKREPIVEKDLAKAWETLSGRTDGKLERIPQRNTAGKDYPFRNEATFRWYRGYAGHIDNHYDILA